MHRTSRHVRFGAIALALTAALIAGSATAALAAPEDHLVVQYLLGESSGTTAIDSSGNGLNATYEGGAVLSGGEGVSLDGVNDFVRLPNNLMAGLTSITVSTEVLIRAGQPAPYFIYGLGNTTSGGVGNGYLFSTGDNYRATIATGNWTTEQNTNSGSALARGVWKTITYTLDDATNTARVYLDGVQVAVNTNVTITPGAIGGGVTTANYLGRSVYSGDRYLLGSLRDFRIYDSALSAAEVAAIHPSDQVRVDRDLAALGLGTLSAVEADLSLPTGGPNGASFAWSSSEPGIISSTGAVTRPSAADGDTAVTLTATGTRGGGIGTRQFEATVIAAPDDQAAVDAAAAALSIVNADDARGNLTLPPAPAGMTLDWQSAAPGIVSTDGIVNRPATDTTVILTATVGKNGTTSTREFSIVVRAAVALAEMEGYAFAYFTGNSIAGENIYFAASEGNNALDWRELNGGQPTLTSQFGTTGLRDPFVIRSPEGDTFYLIATDLSIGGGTSWDASQRSGSRYLEVWESSDLVNWSEQRHVLVSPETAGNTWAPEAYYDESIGAYVVFWASKLYAESDTSHSGATYNRMLYATTRDFVTFSDTQIWQDDGLSRIDSTVIKVDGTYHRFTKDEGAGGTGCSDIIQETSTNLRATLGSWTMIDSCIGANAGTSAVEGPTAFRANPQDVNGEKFYLFVDEYGGRGYIPLETEDITEPDWRVSDEYDLPGSPRHGTVIPVTAAELDALGQGPAAAPVNADGEVLRYNFEDGAGSVVQDVSGNGQDGTIVGGGTWESGVLRLDGSNDYVDIPDSILSRVEDVTVEADVWVDSAQSGNYFIYGLGNTLSGAGNGYLFTSGNSAYRTSLATGNWSTEQTVSQGTALPRGQWVHVTYTLAGSVATIYLNGIAVATGTVTTDPGDIGGGVTLANYLGRSNYDADNRFNGRFREFAIFNRALSPAEVLQASGNTTAIGDVTLAEDVLKVAPIVDSTARTVLFPVEPGTDLSALTPTFVTSSGVAASPASGTTVDLRSPVEVTLTPTAGGASVIWTFEAVEMRSPVLPGLYADPNIAAFGGTYYIYATSDGYPGWGGKEFYVWKSTNLVDWERSAQPFLTLDGASGNVPWASGNAWAPTIIERDGKYYFYFSGHNSALNRKTIGVAVADSPEGPFTAQPSAMVLNTEAVTSGQAIDPAAFHDPVSGKYFLLWGNGGPTTGPVIAELGDDMVSMKSGTFQRITGLTDFREGLFLNYREGIYHLTYAIDDTGSPNYRVGYATSTSINGPWTYRGVILQKRAEQGILATGHSSILNVPGTDDWYVAYHRFAMPGGNGTNRETTIDRLEFDQNGFIVPVTPTLESVDGQVIVDPDPLVVEIGGAATVGETLAATVADEWSVSAYRWTRDGVDIPGADDAQYLLTEADEGTLIGVVVDADKPLWSPATDSAEVGPVVPAEEEVVPVVTASVSGAAPNAAGWRSGPVSVSLSLNDGADATIEYRVGTGDWSDYATAIVVADGTTVLEFRATVDDAPVVGSGGTMTLKVDRIAPESTAVLDPTDGVGTPTSPVTLDISASDATSGAGSTEFRIANGQWTALPAGGAVFTDVGSWPVTYRSTDAAGNVEAVRTITISIADPAAEPGQLTLSAATVRAGSSIDVSGSGFEPGEDVTLTLFSSPTYLGTVTANSAGAFSATVAVPSSIPAGAHTLQAVGVTSGVVASSAIIVLAAVSNIAAAGANADGAVLLMLAMLTVGAALLVVARRRREARSH